MGAHWAPIYDEPRENRLPQSSPPGLLANIWIPAENQFRLAVFRMSNAGVGQDAGGGGDSTPLIVKFPFGERGTDFESCSTKGATFSQMSVANTVNPVVAPEG